MIVKIIIRELYIQQAERTGLQRRAGDFEQRPTNYKRGGRRDGAVKHRLYHERPADKSGAGPQQAHDYQLIASVKDRHPDGIKDNHDRNDNKGEYTDYTGLLEEMRRPGYVIYR